MPSFLLCWHPDIYLGTGYAFLSKFCVLTSPSDDKFNVTNLMFTTYQLHIRPTGFNTIHYCGSLFQEYGAIFVFSVSDRYDQFISILTSGWLPVGPSVVPLPSPFVPSPPPKRHNLSISILTSVCFLLSNPSSIVTPWTPRPTARSTTHPSILTSECENLEIQRCIPDTSLQR